METDDPFEEHLRELARDLPLRDPTAAWKADILSAASREPSKPVRLLPRRLLWAWAAMWIIAMLFRFTTPSNDIPPGPVLSPVLDFAPNQLFAQLMP